MHISVIVLLSVALCCLSQYSLHTVELLRSGHSSSHAQAFDHLLLSISQGHSDELNTVDMNVLLAALGRSDQHDPQLVRRKQFDLATVIHRLKPKQKKEILSSLEMRYQESKRFHYQKNNSLSAALYFLPAPSAIADLAHQANVFFDHGRIHDYLRLSAYAKNNPQRLAAAQQLIGKQFQPYDPALLTASSEPVNNLQAGKNVDWRIAEGHLTALDPWGSVLWQRQLGNNHTVVFGQHYAAIKNNSGIHLIHSDGSMRTLPHIPQATVLGISNHRIWFHIAKKVYGVALDDFSYNTTVTTNIINLPHIPLCAPLDNGKSTLWLTAHDLIYCEDQKIISRTCHLLPMNVDYELTHNGADAFIQATEKNILLRIAAFDTTPTNVQTLCRRYQFDAALARTQNNDMRSQLFEEFMLAPDAWLRTHHNIFNKKLLTDKQRLRLNHRRKRSTYPHSIDAELLSLAAICDNKKLLLAMGEKSSHHQQYALSTSGLRYWATHQQPNIHISAIHNPVSNSRQQRTQTKKPNINIELENLASGTIIVRASLSSDNTILWQQTLPTAIHQPSVSFVIKNNVLTVLAGLNDCSMLNINSGEILLRRHIPSRFSDPNNMYYLGTQRIGCIGPAGINNQIFIDDLRDGKPYQNIFHINTSVVWATAIYQELLISDGIQARVYPQNISVQLPAELLRTKNVFADEHGLGTHDSLYQWK